MVDNLGSTSALARTDYFQNQYVNNALTLFICDQRKVNCSWSFYILYIFQYTASFWVFDKKSFEKASK